jgi:hypothetical protein
MLKLFVFCSILIKYFNEKLQFKDPREADDAEQLQKIGPSISVGKETFGCIKSRGKHRNDSIKSVQTASAIGRWTKP